MRQRDSSVIVYASHCLCRHQRIDDRLFRGLHRRQENGVQFRIWQHCDLT